MKILTLAVAALLTLAFVGCGCNGDKCNTEMNATEANDTATAPVAPEVPTNEATAGTDTLEPAPTAESETK